LRKQLIGKEVFYSVEYNAPGSNKHYGCIFVKNGTLEFGSECVGSNALHPDLQCLNKFSFFQEKWFNFFLLFLVAAFNIFSYIFTQVIS
jgi:hypothetical protein